MSAVSVQKVRAPDPRTARSKAAIVGALMTLIQERSFHSISVQDVLDRAGVARATFYAHYRSKEDVLYSAYEQLFGAMGRMFAPGIAERRLLPVAELLSHVRASNRLVQAFEASGLTRDMWELCELYAARLIARRMPDLRKSPRVARALMAGVVAAIAVRLLKWGVARPHAATPREVDAMFHELASRVLGDR